MLAYLHFNETSFLQHVSAKSIKNFFAFWTHVNSKSWKNCRALVSEGVKAGKADWKWIAHNFWERGDQNAEMLKASPHVNEIWVKFFMWQREGAWSVSTDERVRSASKMICIWDPGTPRVPRSQDTLLFFPISDDKKCLRFQGIMFLSSTLVS